MVAALFLGDWLGLEPGLGDPPATRAALDASMLPGLLLRCSDHVGVPGGLGLLAMVNVHSSTAEQP
jgi:hypothetical protein